MLIDRRTLLGSSLAMAAGSGAAIVGPAVWPPAGGIPLWPGDIPGASEKPPVEELRTSGSADRQELRLRGVAVPMLYPFRPARPNGVALLVLPGGGYEFLAVTKEGVDVARTFAALGFTAFVLAYRLPAEGWARRADVPLQDAQRAVRVIRANASRFGVDAGRTVAMGFSAGGHLAASLATAWSETVYRAVDGTDALSARPDAVALLYAVTSLRPPLTHVGSREHLLGAHPAPAQVHARSPLLRISGATPPSFVLHALDDTVVPPGCTLGWLETCRDRGVPVEGYFPQAGGHGFGTGLPVAVSGAHWPLLFAAWLPAALAGR